MFCEWAAIRNSTFCTVVVVCLKSPQQTDHHKGPHQSENQIIIILFEIMVAMTIQCKHHTVTSFYRKEVLEVMHWDGGLPEAQSYLYCDVSCA